jgi:hypothetical protein
VKQLLILQENRIMAAHKERSPCVVCNPDDASPGEYCNTHRDELHRLDHQYDGLFRLQRMSRGKDHETYNLYLQGDCEPCGRIVASETDPENLSLTVLLSPDLDLDTRIADYARLGIVRTYADQIRQRIEKEIIHSWYGNARACVDIFRTTLHNPQHWDVEPREEYNEEENPEVPSPEDGGHSVH